MKTGDIAPDFTLPNQHGDKVSLYSMLKDKPVVLFFYPKDHTPGCTKEACAFRDSYEVFQEAGAEVVGISSDGPASHLGFAQKYRLPYPLLSDSIGRVRKLFKVPKTLGLLPGRVTYVIDQKGVVVHVFNSQFNFGKHIDVALKTVEALAKRSKLA
jgi:peroxiredoxin Q/BCP